MIRGKIVVACVIMAFAGTVSAQLNQDQAQRAAETRQSVLHLMGWNMAPLGAMARGRIEFDAQRVEINAGRLLALLQMLPDAFAADTRSNDVTTEALDVIWEKPDAFSGKIEDAIQASERLVAATESGDEGQIREAIGALGSSCGSCHDDFRVDN